MRLLHLPLPSQRAALLALTAFCLSSCSSLQNFTNRDSRATTQMRRAAAEKHAEFRAQSKWRPKIFTYDAALAQSTPENTEVVISLKDQRGILLVNKIVAMDFPVASGKKSHPTPLGSFTIRDKQRDYGSNLYGKIYDLTGTVVVSDADSRTDVVPEGGWFVGAKMPYWMRLTDGGVGMHVGYVPGHPASHGCVRLPNKAASVIFEKVKIGTPVEIVEFFDPAAPRGKKAKLKKA